MKRATTESNLNAVTRGKCKGREGAGGRIEKGEADVTHTHTHYTLKHFAPCSPAAIKCVSLKVR
jgi:hypothetical protein